MRVGYLAVDHVAAHLRHIAGDYLDMFTALFAEHATDLELVPHDVIGGEALPAPDAYDAILIPGSRHGVAEEAAGWVADLGEFVRQADEAGTPMVGVCFGHQLIAHALGGQVVRATAGWGVGVHEARVVEREAWMDPAVDTLRLLVSHQDQVVELPPGAQLLATSVHAPVAAFRRGNALGLQGHPEFVPRYAEALMDERRALIGHDVVETSRATLTQPTEHGTVARWIHRFLTTAGGVVADR